MWQEFTRYAPDDIREVLEEGVFPIIRKAMSEQVKLCRAGIYEVPQDRWIVTAKDEVVID
jgi:hypothetical protein